MTSRGFELTVFSIATDRYLSFWIDMIKSAQRLSSFKKVQFLLLTDRKDEIPIDLLESLGEQIVIGEIKHESWPFPTLRRYEYLVRFSDLLVTPHVMYLDSDMTFDACLDFDSLINICKSQPYAFVEHPGYFRPKGFKRLQMYAKHPLIGIKDSVSYFRVGGLGDWERNRLSTAYVARNKRIRYVCGGVWLGQKNSILQMSKKLDENTRIDLSNNLIAKFHDESHLNAFFVTLPHQILSPSYCFESNYPQLKGLRPLIHTVDKNMVKQWIR
jgi:hypothetical protein